MVAIHYALKRIPCDEDITMMTDCLSGLHLIIANLQRPERFRYHKHKMILACIAHLLLARTGSTTMYKVRSHIGIKGNEKADQLAKQATYPGQATDTYRDTLDLGIGRNWLEYKHTRVRVSPGTGNCIKVQEWRNVNDLKDHTLRIITDAEVERRLTQEGKPHDKRSLYLTLFQGIMDQGTRGQGIMHKASNAFWTLADNLSQKDIQTALKIRYGVLVTNRILHRYNPAHTQQCPLCTEDDSITHAMLQCRHPDIHKLHVARHGTGVYTTATAIKQGTQGGGFLIIDAEGHQTYRLLPSWLLPPALQCSRPDIVFIPTFNPDQYSPQQLAQLSINTKAHHTVHIVEFGYCYDFKIHEAIHLKQLQHRSLVLALRARGWHVKQHQIIVSITGIFPGTTADTLQQLGLSKTTTNSLLRSLHIHSLRTATSIYRSRQKLARSAGP